MTNLQSCKVNTIKLCITVAVYVTSNVFIASSSLQLFSFQVFDGIGSSTSEVYVEQGSGFMGRRKRRSMVAAVPGHVGASHEQVLLRHLLAFKDGTGNGKGEDYSWIVHQLVCC